MVSVTALEAYRPLDASVVERARRGDREAYEELAREASHRLYPVAFRIVRDRDLADEALQRALVAIWKELPKLRDSDKFEAWSYRMVLPGGERNLWRACSLLPGNTSWVSGVYDR